MITNNFKDILIEKQLDSELRFDILIELLDNSEFEFIGCKLRGPMAMATYNKAYFNLDCVKESNDVRLFFVILHEYCHLLRASRIGKEKLIQDLSNEDFELFFNSFITEEIIADRFGRLMFFKLNGKIYLEVWTQMLDKKQNQDRYRELIAPLHGRIKDEETYENSFKSFIVNDEEIEWVDINIEQPTFYALVDLIVDGDIVKEQHRLYGDDGDIYYGSLTSDEIIYEGNVTHWRLME